MALYTGVALLAACGQTPSGSETAARTRTYTEQNSHTADAGSESTLRSQVIDLCQGEDPATAPSAEECRRLADSFLAHIKKGSADQASLPTSGGCLGNYMVAIYPQGDGTAKLYRMNGIDALDAALAATAAGLECTIYDSTGRKLPWI